MATKKYPIDSDPFDSKTFEKIFEGISGGNGLLDGFNLDQSSYIDSDIDVIDFSPGTFISGGKIFEVNHTIRIQGIFSSTNEGDYIFFIDTGSEPGQKGIHVGWGLAKSMISKDGRESLFNPPLFVFGKAKFGTHHYGPKTEQPEDDIQNPIIIGLYEVGSSTEFVGPVTTNQIRSTDPSRAKIVFLAYKKNGRFYRNPNIIFPAKLVPGDSFDAYDNGEEEHIDPKPWFDTYNNPIYDIFKADVGSIYVSEFMSPMSDSMNGFQITKHPVDDMADAIIGPLFKVGFSSLGSIGNKLGPMPSIGIYEDAIWMSGDLGETVDGFSMGGDEALIGLTSKPSDSYSGFSDIDLEMSINKSFIDINLNAYSEELQLSIADSFSDSFSLGTDNVGINIIHSASDTNSSPDDEDPIIDVVDP